MTDRSKTQIFDDGVENPTVQLPSDENLTSLNDDLASNAAIEEAIRDQPCSMIDFNAKYTALENTRSGGYGVIAKAQDVVFGRIVATKTLHRRLENNPRAVLRFIHECKLNSRLDHPSIVPIYGLGRDTDGHWHVAMKYINGVSLRRYLSVQRRGYAKKGFSAAVERDFLLGRLEIFLKLCDVVKYAHREKVVHGDLKPENIMIGSNGELYLMDWGCARREGTHVTSILGTGAYLPPETEEDRIVRRSTDIYAMGVILRELVSMREPKTHDTMEWYYNSFRTISFLPGNSLRHVDPRFSIDRRLRAIVDKAANVAPEKRYVSVDMLQKDIRNYLYDRPISALHDSFKSRLFRTLVRNRATEAVLALLLLLLLLTGGLWLHVRGAAATQATDAEKLRRMMLGEETSALAANVDLFDLAGSNRLNLLASLLSEACAGTAPATPAARIYDRGDFLNPKNAPPDLCYNKGLLGDVSLNHAVRLNRGVAPDKYPSAAEVARIGRRSFRPVLQNLLDSATSGHLPPSPVIGMNARFADGTEYRYPGIGQSGANPFPAEPATSMFVAGDEIFRSKLICRDGVPVEKRFMTFFDRNGNPLGTVGVELRLDAMLCALVNYSRENPDSELFLMQPDSALLSVRNGVIASVTEQTQIGVPLNELRSTLSAMRRDQVDFANLRRHGRTYLICRAPLQLTRGGAIVNLIPVKQLRKKAGEQLSESAEDL